MSTAAAQGRQAAPAHRAGSGRIRLQDLALAVLAGGEVDELLAMLLGRARTDLGARTALAVLPAGPRSWSIELVDGEGAAELLGQEIGAADPLGAALEARDADALERADAGPLLAPVGGALAAEPILLTPLDAGREGMGALVVVGADGPRTEGGAGALSAARERAEAIAALIGIVLTGGAHDGDAQDAARLDDERGRIARDLHDLAIQELFAVGMELETLQSGLRGPSALGLNPQIARSAEASVQGIERAVAQIRQIVQSLRRERPEATLSERLRHETGMAITGLGFPPGLRLPANAAELDAEVPEEIAEDVVAVVRECLANAARHARASAVAVSVTVFSEGVDRVVQVSVSDNGRGIDPSVTRRSGLANMASRARRHQGWVDAIPLEPGTMISWRVTLPPR